MKIVLENGVVVEVKLIVESNVVIGLKFVDNVSDEDICDVIDELNLNIDNIILLEENL